MNLPVRICVGEVGKFVIKDTKDKILVRDLNRHQAKGLQKIFREQQKVELPDKDIKIQEKIDRLLSD